MDARRSFYAIVLSQALSGIASQSAWFALSVWLYMRTGSSALYGLIAGAALGPLVLFGPISGVLIDRWPLTRALRIPPIGCLACALVLLGLDALHAVTATTVLLPILAASSFCAFQFPASSAAIPVLFEPAFLGRANGIAQLGFAASQLIGTVLASSFLARLGLRGILLLDIGLFLLSIPLLALVDVQRGVGPTQPARSATSAWKELAEGWAFLRTHPGLIALLGMVVATHFCFGVVQLVFTPLVLSFAGGHALSMVFTAGCLGMLAGGLLQAVWGGPTHRISGVLAFTLLQGLFMLLGAAPPSLPLAVAGAFGVLLALTLVAGCAEPVWQRKVPRSLQGRVSSLRVTLAMATLPVAFLVAGTLHERLAEPWMAKAGPMATWVAHLLGAGPGRGAALLFVLFGLLTMALALVGALYPRLRRVEAELPNLGDHSQTETE